MTVELTTPSNGFRYPTSGNNGANFGLGLQDLADDVDGMWRAGTLVSRPAANAVKANTVYYATDTQAWSICNGSAWQTLLVGGAQIALTLGTNVAAVTGPTPSAQLVAGDRIVLKGSLSTSAGITIGSTLFTVPSFAIPSNATVVNAMLEFGSVTASKPYPIQVQPSTGNVVQANTGDGSIASGAVMPLHGITYFLS